MKYLSLCSGIEAATVAWHPLGWTPAAFSEIEPFPSSVLAHHYPSVPNLGDMTKFKEWPDYDIDVLVGGTPCQSFSVAGLRKGLADPRGNLMLTYLAIADRYQPKWLVWENVPGVLSSNGGKDFGTFLGGLAELRYGFAYRVLDAQHFGVPQRRRRVFVVGCLGDWRSAAAVLFERHGVSGHPAPRRQAGKGFTHDLAPCLTSSGRGVERTGETRGQDAVVATRTWPAETASTLNAAFGSKLGLENQHINEGAPLFVMGNITPTLTSNGDAHSGFRDEHGLIPIAWSEELTASVDITGTIQRGGAGGRNDGVMQQNMAVRRLLPMECERLQGFPDNYTLVPHRGKPAADGPRYKALGNSMAVPCMRWIGERIQMVSEIHGSK